MRCELDLRKGLLASFRNSAVFKLIIRRQSLSFSRLRFTCMRFAFGFPDCPGRLRFFGRSHVENPVSGAVAVRSPVVNSKVDTSIVE